MDNLWVAVYWVAAYNAYRMAWAGSTMTKREFYDASMRATR